MQSSVNFYFLFSSKRRSRFSMGMDGDVFIGKIRLWPLKMLSILESGCIAEDKKKVCCCVCVFFSFFLLISYEWKFGFSWD